MFAPPVNKNQRIAYSALKSRGVWHIAYSIFDDQKPWRMAYSNKFSKLSLRPPENDEKREI
jgi:hypothetical protein